MVSRRMAAAPSRLDEPWRARAACKPGSGYDPELWWPRNDRSQPQVRTRAQQRAATKRAQQLVEAAKAICDNICPVRTECLQWAYEHDERDGIWGGLTPAERGVTPLR